MHVAFFRTPAMISLIPKISLYIKMYLFALITLLQTEIDGTKTSL